MGQEKYKMSLEYPMVPESKVGLAKDWSMSEVHRSQTDRAPDVPNRNKSSNKK